MRFQLGGLVVPFEDAGHHVYTKKKKLKCPVWVTRWQLGINQLQHIESLELLWWLLLLLSINQTLLLLLLLSSSLILQTLLLFLYLCNHCIIPLHPSSSGKLCNHLPATWISKPNTCDAGNLVKNIQCMSSFTSQLKNFNQISQKIGHVVFLG